MSAFRATIHLAPLDREMLLHLDIQRKMAMAALERAERDWIVGATAVAVSRGINPSAVIELAQTGLVVEVTPTTERTKEQAAGGTDAK